MMTGILISIRSIGPEQLGELVLKSGTERQLYALPLGKTLTIAVDSTIKYCIGWYDILTHAGFTCEDSAIIDPKREQCYKCHKRTAFNPAFYNSNQISDQQAAYNDQPHQLYVAYFGNGLAKAGISSLSRGDKRLREQGALLYAVIDDFPSANIARYHEASLIKNGLLNSVTKRQKATQLAQVIDLDSELARFNQMLTSLGYGKLEIISQVDSYFYGSYPQQAITPRFEQPISGQVRGLVGRYLVLSNQTRLYGTWLDTLRGYQLIITDTITPIETTPDQLSLFS